MGHPTISIHIQNQEIFDNPGNSGKALTIPAESLSPTIPVIFAGIVEDIKALPELPKISG